MTKYKSIPQSRRKFLRNLSVLTGVAAVSGFASSSALSAPYLAKDVKDLSGIRRVSLLHKSTGEKFRGAYFVNGKYEPGVMRELDYLLRDFTADELMVMDVRLIDLLSSMQSHLGESEILVTSGYRNAETNRRLREINSNAAVNSVHMYGMAADISVHGCDWHKLCKVAELSGAAGIGSYYGKDFVHVDVADQRQWRR